jgi:hypothetical protein
MPEMRMSKTVFWLTWLIALLSVAAAGIGLFWSTGGTSYGYTSLRGDLVEIYGRGLYEFDTLFSGAAFRGTDAVTLFLGVPLLALSALGYRRGSLRWGLMLLATLAYFLYNYTSMAVGTAYNPLFLVYVTLFSLSLFTWLACWAAVDGERLEVAVTPGMPHRLTATFLIVAGSVTALAWLSMLIRPLMSGETPEHLGIYTTLTTDVLDLGVIFPACIIGAVYLLQHRASGYLTALSLLGIIVTLGPGMAGQTVSQLEAGYEFSTGQIIGILTPFFVMSACGLACLIAMLRNVRQAPTA